MARNAFPIYNGIAPSWADVVVTYSATDIPLIEMEDIAAFHTGRSVEVGVQKGATGGRKKKRTTGAADEEASITLYRDGFDTFLASLVVRAPRVRGNQYAISLVHFDISFKHTPPGSSKIFHRIVRGARVIGDTLDGAEGSDADQVEVPLSVAEIVDIINGKEVVLL